MKPVYPFLGYPFAAIVGQDLLKKALLLCAVNPAIGGVVIRGDKGTAKSTAARGLAEVLSPIERKKGCLFNCFSQEVPEACEVCSNPDVASEIVPVPFINLPLGATEDRLLGSLDFERALKEGKKAFQPGLLASAHRGILYIDEVNLLPDHLVDVLLDVAAMGQNSIQREGMSISHPARFALIGTMNAEEGDLRPQLLDRFAMMVEVKAPMDPSIRSEVVRRRMQFEKNPEGFAQIWHSAQETLRQEICQAQELLAEVEMEDSLLNFCSTLCCELEVVSLRADIVMNKVALALAALAKRKKVVIEDIRQAAELVLPHRRRRKPGEQVGLNQNKLDELIDQAKQKNNVNPKDNSSDSSDLNDDDDDRSGGENNSGGSERSEQVFGIARTDSVAKIAVSSRIESAATSGRRSSSASASRGHYVRSVANENPTAVAVDATIRHSVLRNAGKLDVSKADLHQKVRAGKNANLILFVVDASGSMAAKKRMESVKGSVVSLLDDMYQKRDTVAMITFRSDKAELLLPPTKSVEFAGQKLKELPTGGQTPLAHALALALSTLEQANIKNTHEPLLVILTDGRANVSIAADADPWEEALSHAGQISSSAIPALVLDTEAGYIRFGRARDLAEAMSAEYMPLENFSADFLTVTIRNHLKGRVR